MNLTYVVFPASTSCFANQEGCRSDGEKGEEDKCDLEQVTIFAKAHAVYKTHSFTHTAMVGMTNRTC